MAQVKNQSDRRSVRTRKLIRGAFMKLSVIKDFDEIKVTDLTQEAGINRSTFYLHYTDIPSVLNDVEDSVIDALSDVFNGYDPLQIPHNPYPFFSTLTARAEADEEFCRFIFDSSLSSSFTVKLTKRIIEAVCKRLHAKFPTSDELRLRMTVTFIVGGLVGVYTEWFRDKKDITLEELCRVAAALVSQGYASVVSSAIG